MMCMISSLIKHLRNDKEPYNEEQVDLVQNKQILIEENGHCSNCGVVLNDGENIQYCPYCGSNVK